MTMNNFFVPKYVYNTYLTLSYMSRKIRRAPFLNTVEVLQTGDPLNFMMLMCHREQLLNIICMLGLFEKKRLTFAITTPQLSANCEHFWGCSWILESKGQLISECLLGVIDFPKNQWKIWQISALESKKWSNQQSKSTFL